MSESKTPAAVPSRFWRDAEGTVRDKFWIFCCAANSDFLRFQKRSVMTPAEAGYYMDIPNIIMVQSSKEEAPYGRLNPPFSQYALALRPYRRVAWSVVGSGGFTSEDETAEVIEMAKNTPNLTALMLDDFFGDAEHQPPMGPERLREIRAELRRAGKNPDVMVTFYHQTQMNTPFEKYLDTFDILTMWSQPNALEKLDEAIDKVQKAMPGKRIMLGCYIIDYGKRGSLDLNLMETQAETGLKWLKQGRIEGMIFLGNTGCDFDFESVEWTRDWIRRVGDQKL